VPFRVQAALCVHKDVRRFAADDAGIRVVAGDEQANLAVAGVVELCIQFQLHSANTGVLIVRNMSESSVEIRNDFMGSRQNALPEEMRR
jgi:hypothetical protein